MNSADVADFADFNAKHCLESFICRGSSNLQVSDVEKAVKNNRNMCTCGSKMTVDTKLCVVFLRKLSEAPCPVQ